MEQVPTYLIIGDGRLAKHLSKYFDLLGISYLSWARKSGKNLEKLAKLSTTILIAISDDSIETFVKENSFLKNKMLVHFSGARYIDGVFAFHPLMTFSHDLYDLDFYKNIGFVSFDDEVEFSQVFPGLPNPHSKMDKKLMPYYHSLCVMGGNFTTLLWAKCSEAFKEIGLEKEMIAPYMQKVFENTLSDPVKNLTGPIVRNDTQTIAKNLNALENYKLKNLYQSFVDLSQDMEL